MLTEKQKLETGLETYRKNREEGLRTMVLGQSEMSRDELIQWIKIAYNQDTEQILFLVDQSNRYKNESNLFKEKNNISRFHFEELKEKHENAVDDVDRLEKYVGELVQHLQAETTDPAILEVAKNYYNALSRT